MIDDRGTDGRRHGRNVSREFLADRAQFVRKETVRLSRIAGAGHYSSTFSVAELFAALYYAHLRINPADPKWPDTNGIAGDGFPCIPCEPSSIMGRPRP